MSNNPVSRWALDVGLALALIGTLALVAIVEPRSAPAEPPAALPIEPQPVESEIPPLPPLDVSFVSTFADKEIPPLPPPPPPPPPPAPPPPPTQPFEDKIDPTLLLQVSFSHRRYFGIVKPIGDSELRLTFNEFGHTNHTAVGIDSRVVPFGDRTIGRMAKDLEVEGTVEIADSDKLRGGATKVANRLKHPNGPYVVVWESGGVQIEQRLTYEAGAVSRKMDTVRVRYTLTNIDSRVHSAGLRVMLDTFIGSNDGVPFFIPGRKGVVDKPVELKGDNVPDYLLALERPNLNESTMTVVQIGLTPSEGSEAERPGTVAVTTWPGRRNAGDGEAAVRWLDNKWLYPIGTAFNRDSALLLVYPLAKIEPRQNRVFEYTYGLGSLSGQNPELSLVPYGPFVPGKPFRVSAFVRHAKADQTVTLELPDGLSLDKSDPATKPVEVLAGAAITKVDWSVTPSPDFGGQAVLTAKLTGAAKPETRTIFVPNPRPVLQPLNITGKPTPGGLVRVTAPVFNPKLGTTATLELQKGALLDAGQNASQTLAPGAVAQATWLVRLPPDVSGDLPIKVKLANPDGSVEGMIRVPPTVPKLSGVQVSGLKQAGGVVRITALVLNADDIGSIELSLPTGLTLAAGEKASQPTTAGRQKQFSWLARIEPTRTGSASVSVKLLPRKEEASTEFEITPATPILKFELAQNSPATRGRPFWVVARVLNPSASLTATLELPPGFSIAGRGTAEQALELKTANGLQYAQAAWPVVMDSYSEPKVNVSVKIAGVGSQSVEVQCERGSVIR